MAGPFQEAANAADHGVEVEIRACSSAKEKILSCAPFGGHI